MASAQTFPRLFTVGEANGLLAVLRPLVKRIFDTLELLRKKSESIIREERLLPGSPDFMERLQENDTIARLIHEVKGLVEEINSYGCVCKGVEQGLVDFPCLLGGEIVFLCWRYGEESVGHWHRIEDGFAGRRPLLDQEESGGTRTTYH